MTETQVDEAIKKHVRQSHRKAHCEKLHADGVQGKNTLDLVGSYFYNDKFYPFMVEVKQAGGIASKTQIALVARYSQTGYVSGIVASVEEFKELFK